MSKSKIISDFVDRTKVDKRLANKKRKADALLNLLREKHDQPKKVKTEQLQPDSKKTDVSIKSQIQSNSDETVENNKEKKLSKVEKKKLKKQRLKEVRLQIKKIQKQETQERPAFYFTLKEVVNQQNVDNSGLEATINELPPLYMLDLQHLLTLGLLPNAFIHYPRWCKLARPGKVASVVIIVLDQLTAPDLEQHQECFPFLKRTFHVFTELVSPYQYDGTVMRDVFSVPVSTRTLKTHSWFVRKDKSVSEFEKPIEEVTKIHESVDRRHLMLSPLQLMLEGYPMPIRTQQDRYKDFVFSFDRYRPITAKSPMFGLDCEMCLTSIKKNELTRVSVVNERLETVYDTLVKPRNKIINYLTQYSGITKQMMNPVKKRLEDVQRDLRKLLPSNSIWIGQSLNFDLIALKLFHPYVIDTSVIYNLSGIKWKKTGLRALTAMFLKQDIQSSSGGHCSVEDSKAAMELVLLKLKKGIAYGDATMGAIGEDREETEVKGHVETVKKQPKETEGKEKTEEKEEEKEIEEKVGKDEKVKIEEKVKKDGGEKEEKEEKVKDEKVKKEWGEKEEKVKDEKVKKEWGEKEEKVKDEKVKKEGQEKEEKSSTDSVRRKLFFEHQEKKYHSFFTLAQKEEKSAMIIDRADEISKMDFLKDPDAKVKVEMSDRTRTQTAVTAVQNEDFVWVQLHGLNRHIHSDREVNGTAESGELTQSENNKEVNGTAEPGEISTMSCERDTAKKTPTSMEVRISTGLANDEDVTIDHDDSGLDDGEDREDAEKKKCLRRMDKRVKKIMQSVRPKSLVCVVLSGQARPDKVLNGGVFIKIT